VARRWNRATCFCSAHKNHASFDEQSVVAIQASCIVKTNPMTPNVRVDAAARRQSTMKEQNNLKEYAIAARVQRHVGLRP